MVFLICFPFACHEFRRIATLRHRLIMFRKSPKKDQRQGVAELVVADLSVFARVKVPHDLQDVLAVLRFLKILVEGTLPLIKPVLFKI